MNEVKDILIYNAEKPLLFTQTYFWIFFGIVLAIYSIIHPHRTLRNAFLFLVSIFFYWKTSGLFFLLLLFAICADYFFGNRIYKSKRIFWKKFFVASSVSVNLLVLSYFKYSGFITETVNDIFNSNFEVFNFLAFF